MYCLVLLSALLACAAGAPSNTANATKDGRIVGGNSARIEDHPHQVSLLQFGSFICGGSIISPTCVVTAASCVVGRSPNTLIIRAGSAYYDFDGTIHFVTGGFFHGNYDAYSNDYDVAVLRVFPPFSYSDRVQNIALEYSEMYPGNKVVVTGWGYNWPGSYFSYYLHEAIVEIGDYYTCIYNSYPFFTDRMICTGYPHDGKGPCNGDEGGPLTTLYCPRRLVGIVSRVHWDCGNGPYPPVYTKVSAVWNWIESLCNSQTIPKGIIKAAVIP